MKHKNIVILIVVITILPLIYIVGNHVKRSIQRAQCERNMRNLAKAGAIYANDYSDEYAMQGSGIDDANSRGIFRVKYYEPNGTPIVGASLYILENDEITDANGF